jgi:glycosyltransferase involved in cell wall biosynthesis
MRPSALITVIVCTYNRSGSLRETLTSLANMAVPADFSWELIVVDNNSSDDTRAVIEEFARTSGLNVQYVFEGKQGLSHARNAGLRAAQGEIIAFTDDDVTVDRGWLRALAEAFDQTGCAGLGGKIVPAWPDKPPRWYSDMPPYWTIGPVVAYNLGDQTCEARILPFGANMAMRRSAIQDLGWFRTDLGAGSGTRSLSEETDFFWRLRNAGRKIVYEPGAVVFHPVPPERQTKKYFRRYYFELGRTLAYSEGLAEKVVCYFGVPRHLFRSLIESVVKYLVTLDRQRRFYWQIVVCRVAGQIAEMRRLSAEKGLAPTHRNACEETLREDE